MRPDIFMFPTFNSKPQTQIKHEFCLFLFFKKTLKACSKIIVTIPCQISKIKEKISNNL